MCRSKLSLLFLLSMSAVARGGHDRVSLDHKVGLSDLIVVGTVSAIDDAQEPCPVASPATTASKVAVIRIESVISGRTDQEVIKVCLETDYDDENRWFDPGGMIPTLHNYETLLAPGRYLLFLRKLSPPFFATVNWRHGALRVSGGKVDDPRWPSDQASQLHRFNACVERRGRTVEPFKPPPDPARYKIKVSLEKAIAFVQDAIKLAQSQVQLGKIFVENSRVPVLLETLEKQHRLLVRMPFRADRPPFNMDRITAELLTRDTAAVRIQARFTLGFAPKSVDPLRMTREATLRLPTGVGLNSLVGVRLFHYGKRLTLCMPDEAASNCRSHSVAKFCPACGSWEVLRIEHRFINPGLGLPCEGFLLDQFHTGARDPTAQWHCNTCGNEWQDGATPRAVGR